MKISWARNGLLILLSFVLSIQNVLASVSESNFWKDRREAVVKENPTLKQTIQLASLPSTFNSQAILKQLPAINPTLPNIPQWTPTSKTQRQANQTGKRSSQLQTLLDSIPLIYGSIQEVYDSGNEKLAPVVLLQDVHLNSEAQTNIAAVLQELIDQKQIGLVGVEGAFRPFDFKLFRAFSDKKITREVSDAFLNKNILAAPTFVGITSSVEPPLFVGIDDLPHYKANVEAYLSTIALKKKTKKQIEETKKVLAEQKVKTFSPELKVFDQRRTSYHKGDMGIGAYVQHLNNQFGSLSNEGRELEKDFVIDQFLEAFNMESTLNFKKVDEERKIVIEKLTKVLSEKELSNLLAQSLAYRMGRLNFGSYYQNLKNLCGIKGLTLQKNPAFDNYIRYVLLSDGIKGDALFSSVNKLEENILHALAKTQKEKDLANTSEHVSLTEKIIDFSLTPTEWEKYKKGKNSGVADVMLKPFEQFYEQADIRSHKMVDHLLAQSAPGNKAITIGGFHSPQIAQLLREQKVSYVIVTPKVTKIDDAGGTSYLSIFTREKSSLDQLFKGEKLFIAPATVTSVGAGARTGMFKFLAEAAVLNDRAHGNPGAPDLEVVRDRGINHVRGRGPALQDLNANVDPEKEIGEGITLLTPSNSDHWLENIFKTLRTFLAQTIKALREKAVAAIDTVSPFIIDKLRGSFAADLVMQWYERHFTLGITGEQYRPSSTVPVIVNNLSEQIRITEPRYQEEVLQSVTKTIDGYSRIKLNPDEINLLLSLIEKILTDREFVGDLTRKSNTYDQRLMKGYLVTKLRDVVMECTDAIIASRKPDNADLDFFAPIMSEVKLIDPTNSDDTILEELNIETRRESLASLIRKLSSAEIKIEVMKKLFDALNRKFANATFGIDKSDLYLLNEREEHPENPLNEAAAKTARHTKITLANIGTLDQIITTELAGLNFNRETTESLHELVRSIYLRRDNKPQSRLYREKLAGRVLKKWSQTVGADSQIASKYYPYFLRWKNGASLRGLDWVKAQLGRPLAGAPAWEGVFQFPTQLSLTMGMGWVVVVPVAVLMSLWFARAHSDRSPPEKRWLFVVGTILTLLTILPFLFVDHTTLDLTHKFIRALIGLSLNYLAHIGYNAFVLKFESKLPAWMGVASLNGPLNLTHERLRPVVDYFEAHKGSEEFAKKLRVLNALVQKLTNRNVQLSQLFIPNILMRFEELDHASELWRAPNNDPFEAKIDSIIDSMRYVDSSIVLAEKLKDSEVLTPERIDFLLTPPSKKESLEFHVWELGNRILRAWVNDPAGHGDILREFLAEYYTRRTSLSSIISYIKLKQQPSEQRGYPEYENDLVSSLTIRMQSFSHVEGYVAIVGKHDLLAWLFISDSISKDIPDGQFYRVYNEGGVQTPIAFINGNNTDFRLMSIGAHEVAHVITANEVFESEYQENAGRTIIEGSQTYWELAIISIIASRNTRLGQYAKTIIHSHPLISTLVEKKLLSPQDVLSGNTRQILRALIIYVETVYYAEFLLIDDLIHQMKSADPLIAYTKDGNRNHITDLLPKGVGDLLFEMLSTVEKVMVGFGKEKQQLFAALLTRELLLKDAIPANSEEFAIKMKAFIKILMNARPKTTILIPNLHELPLNRMHYRTLLNAIKKLADNYIRGEKSEEEISQELRELLKINRRPVTGSLSPFRIRNEVGFFAGTFAASVALFLSSIRHATDHGGFNSFILIAIATIVTVLWTFAIGFSAALIFRREMQSRTRINVSPMSESKKQSWNNWAATFGARINWDEQPPMGWLGSTNDGEIRFAKGLHNYPLLFAIVAAHEMMRVKLGKRGINGRIQTWLVTILRPIVFWHVLTAGSFIREIGDLELDEDLLGVGKTKLIGYLPLQTIGSRRVQKKFADWAKEHGLASQRHLDGTVFSGALYVYDRERLRQFLIDHQKIFDNDGIPTDPDKFIEYINYHQVNQTRRSYALIGVAFGNKMFSKDPAFVGLYGLGLGTGSQGDTSAPNPSANPINLKNSSTALVVATTLSVLSYAGLNPDTAQRLLPLILFLPIFMSTLMLSTVFFRVGGKMVGESNLKTGPPAGTIQLYGKPAVSDANAEFIQFQEQKDSTSAQFQVNPILFSLLAHKSVVVRFATHLVLNLLLVPLHETLHARGLKNEGLVYSLQLSTALGVAAGAMFVSVWVVPVVLFVAGMLALFSAKGIPLRTDTVSPESLMLDILAIHKAINEGGGEKFWPAIRADRDHKVEKALRQKLEGVVQPDFQMDFQMENGHLVGYILYQVDKKYLEGRGAVYIDLIAVHPNARKGVGTAMMKNAFEFAKREGYSQVYLKCYKINSRANDFYTRLPKHPEMQKVLQDVQLTSTPERDDLNTYIYNLPLGTISAIPLKSWLIIGAAFLAIAFDVKFLENMYQNNGSLGQLSFLMDTVVVAGILEEFLFRYGIYRKALRPYLGVFGSVLISSVLFLFVHILFSDANGAALFGIFIRSLLLTLIYEASGSLRVSMLTHAILNLSVLSVLAPGIGFIPLSFIRVLFILFVVHWIVVRPASINGLNSFKTFGNTNDFDEWVTTHFFKPALDAVHKRLKQIGIPLSTTKNINMTKPSLGPIYGVAALVSAVYLLVNYRPLLSSSVLLAAASALVIVVAIQVLSNRYIHRNPLRKTILEQRLFWRSFSWSVGLFLATTLLFSVFFERASKERHDQQIAYREHLRLEENTVRQQLALVDSSTRETMVKRATEFAGRNSNDVFGFTYFMQPKSNAIPVVLFKNHEALGLNGARWEKIKMVQHGRGIISFVRPNGETDTRFLLAIEGSDLRTIINWVRATPVKGNESGTPVDPSPQQSGPRQKTPLSMIRHFLLRQALARGENADEFLSKASVKWKTVLGGAGEAVLFGLLGIFTAVPFDSTWGIFLNVVRILVVIGFFVSDYQMAPRVNGVRGSPLAHVIVDLLYAVLPLFSALTSHPNDTLRFLMLSAALIHISFDAYTAFGKPVHLRTGTDSVNNASPTRESNTNAQWYDATPTIESRDIVTLPTIAVKYLVQGNLDNHGIVRVTVGKTRFQFYVPRPVLGQMSTNEIHNQAISYLSFFQNVFLRAEELGWNTPDDRVFNVYFGDNTVGAPFATEMEKAQYALFPGHLYPFQELPKDRRAHVFEHEIAHNVSRIFLAGSLLSDTRTIAIEEGLADYLGNLPRQEDQFDPSGRIISSQKIKISPEQSARMAGLTQLDIEKSMGGNVLPLARLAQYAGATKHTFGLEFIQAFVETFGQNKLADFLVKLGELKNTQTSDYGTQYTRNILEALFNRAAVARFELTLHNRLRKNVFSTEHGSPLTPSAESSSPAQPDPSCATGANSTIIFEGEKRDNKSNPSGENSSMGFGSPAEKDANHKIGNDFSRWAQETAARRKELLASLKNQIPSITLPLQPIDWTNLTKLTWKERMALWLNSIFQRIRSVFGVFNYPHSDDQKTHQDSPAKELASKMIHVLKATKDRQALAHELFNLIDTEKIFGDNEAIEPAGKSAPWQDVSRELISELRDLKASGSFDLNRDGERVANLLAILGLVLSQKEQREFVQEFNEIFTSARYTEAAGTAVRVNNAAQAKHLIAQLPDGQKLILGIETTEDLFLKELASSGVNTAKLLRENRLGFVSNSKDMNALQFVQAAKQTKLLENEPKSKLRLLVLDGVTLPANFFDFKTDFERNQLAHEAFVFFITQNLQAIEIDTKLLPDWNQIRTRLIQA